MPTLILHTTYTWHLAVPGCSLVGTSDLTPAPPSEEEHALPMLGGVGNDLLLPPAAP